MQHALVIDEEAMNDVSRVVDFATKRENYYVPGVTDFVPGDRDEYVIKLNHYRCVFSITLFEGEPYRHLSISMPEHKVLPNPTVAFTLAGMFGFTGGEKYKGGVITDPAENWLINASAKTGLVVLAQPLGN